MEFYFDRSLFGWAVKDASSKYVYANPRACQYFGVQVDGIAGCTDKDLVYELGEWYSRIVNDDKEVILKGKTSWDNYVPPFFLKQGYIRLC